MRGCRSNALPHCARPLEVLFRSILRLTLEILEQAMGLEHVSVADALENNAEMRLRKCPTLQRKRPAAVQAPQRSARWARDGFICIR